MSSELSVSSSYPTSSIFVDAFLLRDGLGYKKESFLSIAGIFGTYFSSVSVTSKSYFIFSCFWSASVFYKKFYCF